MSKEENPTSKSKTTQDKWSSIKTNDDWRAETRTERHTRQGDVTLGRDYQATDGGKKNDSKEG